MFKALAYASLVCGVCVLFSMSERAEALLSASVSDMEAQVKAKEEECEAAIQSLRDDFERQYKQADKTEDAPQPDEGETSNPWSCARCDCIHSTAAG